MDSHSSPGYQVPSFLIHPRDWTEIVKASELLRLDPAEFVIIAPYLLARRVIEIDDRMEKRIKEALDLYRK
ncbi:hypothetical protein [Aquaspirillum soli]